MQKKIDEPMLKADVLQVIRQELAVKLELKMVGNLLTSMVRHHRPHTTVHEDLAEGKNCTVQVLQGFLT